jgi:hypothetical protein
MPNKILIAAVAIYVVWMLYEGVTSAFHIFRKPGHGVR